MPRWSAWAIRAAFLHLMTGFTLGALLLAHKGVPYWPAAWVLLPSHIEILLVGWMVQFALGVAFWILPRYPGGSRGNETLAVASIVLINLGVLLAAFQAAGPVLLVLGMACQVAAGALFAAHAWGRIRPLVI